MANGETKKFILIASPDQKVQDTFNDIIKKLSPDDAIFFSKDGSEAQIKYHNTPCHIVVTEIQLEKTSGIKLVESLLTKEKSVDTAYIIIGHIPEEGHFVDEVVRGKVQFISDANDAEKVTPYVMKALNYISFKQPTEYKKKFLAPADVLIREGEKGKSVFILRRGKLKAYVKKNGSEHILGFVNAGEFVGEMAYINGEPRSATVEAVSECELVEIPMENLDQILFQKPAWAKALMTTLSKRLKSANENHTSA